MILAKRRHKSYALIRWPASVAAFRIGEQVIFVPVATSTFTSRPRMQSGITFMFDVATQARNLFRYTDRVMKVSPCMAIAAFPVHGRNRER